MYTVDVIKLTHIWQMNRLKQFIGRPRYSSTSLSTQKIKEATRFAHLTSSISAKKRNETTFFCLFCGSLEAIMDVAGTEEILFWCTAGNSAKTKVKPFFLFRVFWELNWIPQELKQFCFGAPLENQTPCWAIPQKQKSYHNCHAYDPHRRSIQ